MKEVWTYKKLGDIASYVNGFPFKPTDWVEDGKPIIRIQNLTGSQSKFNRCSRDDIPSKYFVKRGDILISWSATLGVYEWELEDALLNQHIFKVVFDKIKINKSFFRYAIIISLAEMGRHTNGATMKHIRKGDFDNIEIPIPSLAEQERIVERLDSAFAQIDELKSNAEKQLADARALFQSALTQAMQPKPGWQEKKLVNVCDIFGRIGFRGYTTKDLVSSQNDGAISLSPSNIQNGEMDYSKRTYISWFKYNESPEIKIFNGDILLVKTGSSYGKSALVKDLPHEATINPQSVVLKNFRINNEFFAYQLRTERVKKEFDQFVSGTAIPTFSQAKLGTVPIYLPSEIEQEQIVSYLNSLNNHVRELEEISRKTAAECDVLKQALLRQIFE